MRRWRAALRRAAATRGWRAAVAPVALLVLLAAGFTIRYMLPPRAMSFAGGEAVALADYVGPNPTGVPPSLAGATLVERGRYLAEAADCQACHTAEGGIPFAGGRAFRTGFGTLYSPNLTPDPETGLGNWTEADFLRALHKGIAKDGSNLYPAFPYESYTLITDDDAKAIRAYLSSLPSVHAATPANALIFPFNQRWLMAFWSFFYNPDTRFEPRQNRSPQWNRGAYLVEALAHCGDCHTPRNLGQAPDNNRKFSGFPVDGWTAYNITQDHVSGIGGWSDDEIASYLKTGHAKGRGTAGGPMAEAVDVSLSRIAPSDIAAMVAYLRTIPKVATTDLPAIKSEPASEAAGAMTAQSAPQGMAIFAGACASCHGWSGRSLIREDASLVGARSVNDPAAANVVLAVLSGITRPSPALTMPSFRDAFTDSEIAALANYVTARFGSDASSITAKTVGELRAQSAP
jgi:mono/diheme cytochrome c family protein